MKPKQTGKFRAIGADILRPKSMQDLLDDKTQSTEQEPQVPPPAQMHICTDASVQRDVRLHVFIKGTLSDALNDEVNRRKKDPAYTGKQASNRSVVEDALAAFFVNR